jgi:hypothetical protein
MSVTLLANGARSTLPSVTRPFVSVVPVDVTSKIGCALRSATVAKLTVATLSPPVTRTATEPVPGRCRAGGFEPSVGTVKFTIDAISSALSPSSASAGSCASRSALADARARVFCCTAKCITVTVCPGWIVIAFQRYLSASPTSDASATAARAFAPANTCAMPDLPNRRCRRSRASRSPAPNVVPPVGVPTRASCTEARAEGSIRSQGPR